MWKGFAAAMLLVAASAGTAFAQEERPSNRYMGCRAAEGVDQRLSDICSTIDEIHRRLDDARGQSRRIAEIQYAHSVALLGIGDLGDEQAYRDCIEVARESQAFYRRSRFPTRWGVLQYYVAQSAIALAELGDETMRNDAPQLAREAVDAVDRSTQSEFWAATQVVLADAYLVNGRGDPQSIQRAIEALQAAMEIYIQPTHAERRARVEQRLAELYRAIGREPDPV
jgi:hypothetical protein